VASAAKPKPRVLVVDDDEGLLILMADTLREHDCEVATADSARAARTALEREKPDLMVLDLKLKDGSGPALVADLQRDNARVPFVVVTGQGDEKAAVEVMKQGALDYVIKDARLLDVLPAVMQRALAAVAQEKALAAAQAEHRRLEREILAAGERERHSIGADLHDNLGQQLTALELMCTAAKEEAGSYPTLAKRLDAMGKMLREAITQTRFLARGLVPVGDEPDALQIGLAELVSRTNALGRVRCHFDSAESIALSDSFVSGHLYRIAQEAVHNAVKHARAKNVTIRLAREASQLVLEISDDGAGLPKIRATDRAGLGVGIMQHRARAIGAELEISSKRGEGVVVRCTLPLPK
jgi:signal transduction histidine kinase